MFLGWQFWIPSQVWMWWSAWRQKPSTTWLFRAMTKLNNIHFFFFACHPGPNTNLICPRNIKLNWNGLTILVTVLLRAQTQPSHDERVCCVWSLNMRSLIGLVEVLKPCYKAEIFLQYVRTLIFSSTVRFWDEVLGLGNGLIQVALRYLTQNWHNIPKHVTFSRWAWKVNVYKQCLNSGSQRLWGLVS